MKELTIEEKAQRYDEAIKIAREINNEQRAQPFNVMTRVFPELKESEDENIRKWIIDELKDSLNTIRSMYSGDYDNRDKDDILRESCLTKGIAWLEKQGEHANFRNKIQIGDKVTRNEDGVLVNLSQLKRVAKKQTEQKLYVNDNAKEMFIKALERVEEQNNKGYKLTDCDKNSWWEDFKAYTSCTIEQKPAAWSEENKEVINLLLELVYEQDKLNPRIPSHEKRKLMLSWLKLLKERVQPKQEWSDEDERLRKSCIAHIEDELERIRNDKYGHSEIISDLEESCRERINWLESLRPQNRWKPSDAQMASITCAVRKMKESACYDSELVSLLNDLKKLREE